MTLRAYTISGFVDAPEVYDAAAGLPLPPSVELPPVLDLAPVISNLRAVLSGDVNTPQVLLRWDSKNADYFIVHTSADNGVTWAPIATRLADNFLTHEALVGAIKYRVSGVNFLQGQWVEVAVNTGEPSFVAPAPVTDLVLSEAFTGTELRFQWASDYTHHKVAFYLGGVEKLAVDVVGEIFSYSLSAASARANGLGRSFTVRVWSVSQYGKLSATSADLAVTNPLPDALDNLAVQLSLGTVFVTYDLPTYADFDGVSIWVSTENNFTPSNANRVADRIRDKSFSFEMPDTLLYVRVAALDVWGDDYFASGQYTLDPVDLFERLTGEILESHLHQSLLEPIQLINAPGGLVDQIEQNAQNISTEIQNRTLALIDEAETRMQQVQAETAARTLALQQEALARGTAITAVQETQQTVNQSFTNSINTLTSATNTNASAIQNVQTTSTNQFNSLSQQMSTLTAGTNSQFDHAVIWYFDSGAEGWTSNSGAAANASSNGWIRAEQVSGAYVFSPLISVDGTQYTQVRARIKKVGTPTWDGALHFHTSTDGATTASKRIFISEPVFDNGIANITFAVDLATWIGQTITRIRLDLAAAETASNYFEIDWVAVGRPSPGASSAELSSLQQTLSDNYSALSQDVANTNAAVANKAEASAVNALGSRVTEAENTIFSQSDEITALQAGLTGGGNLLQNTDFEVDLTGWGRSATMTGTGQVRNDGAAMTGGINYARVYGTGGPSGGYVDLRPSPVNGFGAPALPGIRYCASAYLAQTNATNVQVYLQFYDVNFAPISAPSVQSTTVKPISGVATLLDTTRLSVIATAPSLTRFAVIICRVFNTSAVTSSLLVAHPMIEEMAEAQTGPSVYRSGALGLRAADAANSAATALLDARVVATEEAIVAQSTQSTNLASSLFPNAIFPNSTFIDWPAGNVRPAGWFGFGSVVPTRHTGDYAYTGSNAVQFVTGTDGAGMRIDTAPAKAVDASYLDVELTFTVTAGASLSGAGVLVRWFATDATWVEHAIALNNIFAPGTFTLNKKYTISVRAKKPSAVGKTFSYNQVYLMANYNGSGLGVLTSKTIIFDSLLVTVCDESANAVDLLETRVEATENYVNTSSSQITELEASKIAQESVQWSRDYSVSATTVAPLLSASGSALPITINGSGTRTSFVATAVTLGTGAVTQTVARFYHDGTSWQVEQLSNISQSGQHPIFGITVGAPSVRTAHASLYTVRVLMQSSLFGGYGVANSKAIEATNAIVNNSSTGVVATSNKIIALQNALGGAEAGAFTTLKSQVENSETGLAAVGSRVDQVQATMPGGGNLFPSETDFNTGSVWRLASNTTGQTVTTGVDYAGANWVPPGMHQFGGSVPGVVAINQYFDLFHDPFPCEPGKRYCFAVWTASHRSSSQVFMQFLNAAGAGVGTFSSSVVAANSGGTSLSGWNRSSVFGVAPATAVRVQFFVRCNGTGSSNPYLWLLRPMYSVVANEVSVAPPYSPSGATATIAAVKVTAEAAVNSAGQANARWDAKATIGDLTGGVGFWIDTSVNPPVVRFGIHADQFYIFSPGKNAFRLVIDGDDIVMPGGKLQVESINTDRLVVNAVTSTSYVDGWSATGSHPGGPTITASISRGGVTQAKVMSVTKAKAGSSILATASVEYWFSTNSSLVAGNYVVEFYLNTITFRNSSNGFAGNSVGGRGQDKRVMYLRPSEAYNVKMSYSAVLSNSSHTGLVYLSLENPYVQIKTSADADLSSRMANMDLIVYSSMTEIKV